MKDHSPSKSNYNGFMTIANHIMMVKSTFGRDVEAGSPKEGEDFLPTSLSGFPQVDVALQLGDFVSGRPAASVGLPVFTTRIHAHHALMRKSTLMRKKTL